MFWGCSVTWQRGWLQIFIPVEPLGAMMRIWKYDTIYEVPSGMIEKGETPPEAAERELEEEIGYTAKRLTHIFDFYTDASLETQTTHCFVAEGLEKTKQRLDSDEVIKPIKMPVSRAITLIKRNRIKEVGSLGALLYCLYIRR